MATFHDRTAAPVFQRGLLRTGGRPCAVLTSADVVTLTADVPDLPIPFVFRPVPPVDDPRSADDLLTEIAAEIDRQEAAPTPLLPPSAPLPSLTAALSRRRAIFGAVALEGADAARARADPQTARSIGMGPPWADLADVVDLASLAAGRRRHAYRMAPDAVDHLIALMDALEAHTEDMEPDTEDADPVEIYGEGDNADHEPSLGAPENHPARYHLDMDGREHFSRGRRQLGDQTAWAAGGLDDREDIFADLEHEPGYDLPEGDDERDGSGGCSGFDDDEHMLGWNETVSQRSLCAPTDDGDEDALERHGRGFLRSGPEDDEDSDPGERDWRDWPADEDGLAEQCAGFRDCPALPYSVGGHVA